MTDQSEPALQIAEGRPAPPRVTVWQQQVALGTGTLTPIPRPRDASPGDGWSEPAGAGATAGSRLDNPTGRGIAVVEYALALAGYLLLFSTHLQITSDGRHRYDALNQLLSGRGLSADRYQLVGPLFATPLWLLGQARFTGRDTMAWLVHYNLLLFGTTLVLLFVLLRKRVDPVLLRRFLLLLVAGSMIATHAPNFYGEMFTATTVAVGIFAVACVGLPRVVRGAAWLAMILGAANTPASVPGLGLTGGEFTLRTRRLRYLIPVFVAAAIIMGENWLRRGNPLDQGYGDEKFNYPFVLGVLAILFSFGKGLVFFIPGLLLPIRGRIDSLYDATRINLPQAYRSGLLFVAGMVLVYASWWAWNGDTSWGPRFFLIAIFPGSLALAVWLARGDERILPNLALLAVLAVSLWIGANSMAFNDMWPPHCYEDMEYCRFDVTDSQLWYPLRAWPEHLSRRTIVQLGYHAVVLVWLAIPVVANLGRATARLARSRRHLLRLDAWQL